METKYLKINPADNVAVAIVTLPAGEKLTVDGVEITLNEEVPAGHKFALKDFAEGENVIKYGYPIGHARMAKKQGDWMNENNIQTNGRIAGLYLQSDKRYAGYSAQRSDIQRVSPQKWRRRYS